MNIDNGRIINTFMVMRINVFSADNKILRPEPSFRALIVDCNV